MTFRIKVHLSKAILVSYLALSLPVVLVFIKSEYFRFVYFETVSHWTSNVHPIEYAFVGDSITAGGRNWGLRLESNPFSAKNFAGDGYTVHQISNQVSKALEYEPKWIFIMAGTNDILSFHDEKQDLSTVSSRYKELLGKFDKEKTIPIITLIPFTQREQYNPTIKILNQEIKK